ncbi:hypothetical protein BGZ58_006442 [Dissophora ornata]|nr:hypothetical protein BGZ58_006442 [Dissophora ornata]
MSNEPVSASSLDGGESDLSQQLCKDQVYRPETPLRGSSRTARTRPNNPQQTYKDQHRQLPKSQLEQRKGLLARHQILSDESLSKDVKIRLSQDSKDFPPAPPAPLQTASRIRHRTEGGDGESSPLPDLPAASETLMKIESSGLIPQDVLKNMDPKDMKRAMMATVIASRVYKVMSSEQLEILKKEQCELEDFVESMNVALHIEIRMRDASHSLIRLHENSSNLNAVKIASSQLNATSRKMDDIFQKTQQAMWRLMTIQRLLLQHESAILNAGLRRLDSDNRELSRTVMQLDEARGQEKEEKIKWKKEHNRLKFQSMLLPATPVSETFTDGRGPSNPEMQQVLHQHQTQLASMEQYVKSLNDDVLQKDEKIVDVTNQLQAVKHWADDFLSAVQGGKSAQTEIGLSASNDTLQAQLHRLQSSIEFEFKGMHLQVQEFKSMAKVNNSKKSAHSRTQSAPANDPRPESHMNRVISEAQRQDRRARASKSHSRKGSDLQSVLHQSLLELDRQILLEDSHSARSSRSSSTSTNSTAFSNDSFDRVPTNMSRNSSGSTSGSQGSSARSSGSSSDEDTAVEEDTSKEIDRLNSIMEELRQLAATRNVNVTVDNK